MPDNRKTTFADLESRYLREDDSSPKISTPSTAEESARMVAGPENSSSCVQPASDTAELHALYLKVSAINPL